MAHAHNCGALPLIVNLEDDPVISHTNTIATIGGEFLHTDRAWINGESGNRFQYTTLQGWRKRVVFFLRTGTKINAIH